MAVYIARALVGSDAHVPAASPVVTFADISADFWALKYIEYAVARGVVQSYGDGTYRPDVELDRAQMAVFLARALCGGEAQVPAPPAVASFPDVPTNFWSYPHVEYVKRQGVNTGYPDGTYRPDTLCTRDQMAVCVARALQLPI